MMTSYRRGRAFIGTALAGLAALAIFAGVASLASGAAALASSSGDLSISLSPRLFGFTEIGGAEPLMVATVTNTGSEKVKLSSVSLSDTTNFRFPDNENTCRGQLKAGQSCTAHIYFRPQRRGFILATFTVVADHGWSRSSAFVAGFGYLPPLVPSATAVDFGNKTINTGPESRTVRLFNRALVPITVTELAASGAPFDVAQDCVTTIAPDGFCDMEVSFDPTEALSYEGTVTIRDAYGHDQEIDLAGTGIPQGTPDISLSTTEIRFSPQQVGTVSSAYPVTIVSTGQADLVITSIVATDAFVVAGDCVKTLSPAQSCTFTVAFAPTAAGDIIGTVTITDNAQGEPTQQIALSGTAYEPGRPAVELSPAALDFGPQTVGSTGETMYVVLSNVGDAQLTVSEVSIEGEFAQLNDCVGVVPAGGRCAIAASFAPLSPGELAGTITVADDAGDGEQRVALRGEGTAVATPQASLSATSFDFGSQALNTATTRTLTVTNTGTSDLSIGLTSIDGEGAAAFGKVDGCRESAVEPGTSCSIDITFFPTDEGSFAATLAIADDAIDSPQVIALTGSAAAPASGEGAA